MAIQQLSHGTTGYTANDLSYWYTTATTFTTTTPTLNWTPIIPRVPTGEYYQIEYVKPEDIRLVPLEEGLLSQIQNSDKEKAPAEKTTSFLKSIKISEHAE